MKIPKWLRSLFKPKMRAIIASVTIPDISNNERRKRRRRARRSRTARKSMQCHQKH